MYLFRLGWVSVATWAPLWLCVRASHCRDSSFSQAQAAGAEAPEAVNPGPSSTGSVGGVHQLSCSTACGTFLGQGANLHPLHWQTDSLPLSPRQARLSCFFNKLFVVIFPSSFLLELLYNFAA